MIFRLIISTSKDTSQPREVHALMGIPSKSYHILSAYPLEYIERCVPKDPGMFGIMLI